MKSLYVAGATLAITLCTLVPAQASDESSEPDEVQVISVVDVYQSSDDAIAEEPLDESAGEELSGEPDAVIEPTELDAVIAAAEEHLSQFENIRVVSIAWDLEAGVVVILADKPEQETFDYLMSLGVAVRVIDIDTPFDEARFEAAMERYFKALAGSELSAGFNVDQQNRQIVISCDETTATFLTEMFWKDVDFELVRFELADWGPALDERGVVLESTVDPSVIRSNETPVALALANEPVSELSPAAPSVVKVPGEQVIGDSSKTETKPESVDQTSTLTSTEPSSTVGFALPLIALLTGLTLAGWRFAQKRFKKLS
jgi:hypothetical protein